MTNKDLLRALGQVKDTWVEEAIPTAQRHRPSVRMRWVPVAACLLMAVAVGIGIAAGGLFDHPVTITSDVDITSSLPTGIPDLVTEPTAPAVTANTHATGTHTTQTTTPTSTTGIHTTQTTTPETALIPHWDDQPISQQFPEVLYNDHSYVSRLTTLAADRVGDPLGTATLSGYDIYTDTAYTANATLYAINAIASDCAVALQFEGRDDYYVYVYSWYQPATLGDFITALNLRETLTTGSVWADTMEYTGLTDEVVWQMLLCDPTTKTVTDFDTHIFRSAMSISVSVPLLGYQNVSLAVTEDGYLTTNILDTEKAFFIGEEAVQRFIDYVTEHCESHEIVYDTTATGIPE